MRIRPILTTLAVALMLVMGLDYVSYAATGHSLVLGKGNSASKGTTISRTSKGPVLTLKAKGGGPALAVNTGAKIARLNADKVDGLDSTQLTSRVTVFQPDACVGTPGGSLGTSFVKMGDIGSFGTHSAGSHTRIDLSTMVSATNMNATAVVIEMRVDGKATTLGHASMLYLAFPDYVSGNISGIFDLAPGTHTLSVWARTTDGTAYGAHTDPGCFNSTGVNNVIVTEFH